MSTPEPAGDVRSGAGATFWVGAAVGATLVAFAIRGLLTEERAGAASAARWFAGGALAVDLLVIPAAAAVGWLARRIVPSWAWPAVRAGLLASAVLVVFALPLVLDLGGTPDNPTVRPRPYATGLAQSLALVWAVAAAWALASWARRTPSSAAAPDARSGEQR